MNVVSPMGKVEQAIVEAFDKAAGALPGDDSARKARRHAIGRFATTGLPSRRIEEWRYTDLKAKIRSALPPVAKSASKPAPDLARLLGPALARLPAVTYVFVNGRLQSWDNGPLIGDDPRVEIMALHKALADGKASLANASDDVAVTLNTAFATDGAVVRITEGAKLDVPVHLVFVSDLSEPASIAVRNRIEIGRGARCTIIESHVALGAGERQTNAVSEVTISDKADAVHVKLLAEGPASTHLGTSIVALGRDCIYRPVQLTESPGLARNQSFVAFEGEGATFDFKAASLVRGHEHADTTLVIDHKVPRCTSREHFKTVLDGEAHAVFQGKVIVQPGAQKTDGKQMAQALMLSETAEFDSKPELEIYADDVACGHGSTVAEIDADMLFYCRSRGIPLAEARRLLVESFVGEALDKITDDGVREVIHKLAMRWLDRTA